MKIVLEVGCGDFLKNINMRSWKGMSCTELHAVWNQLALVKRCAGRLLLAQTQQEAQCPRLHVCALPKCRFATTGHEPATLEGKHTKQSATLPMLAELEAYILYIRLYYRQFRKQDFKNKFKKV